MLHELKKEKFGPNAISLGKLEDWARGRQEIPVLPCGLSDKSGRFHPVALSVCKNETSEEFMFLFHSVKNIIVKIHGTTYSPQYLIGDASPAIIKGFEAVFGEGFIRIMCWVLAIMNMDRKMSKIADKKKHAEIRQDIVSLQLAISDGCFQHAMRLFKNKWANCNGQIDEFLTYMQENWVEQNCLWDEGAARHICQTDNCLEATDRVLKATSNGEIPCCVHGQYKEVVQRTRPPKTPFHSGQLLHQN